MNLVGLYNFFVPIIRKITGLRTVSLLIYLDGLLSTYLSSYNGIVFVIFKDKKCYLKNELIHIPIKRILEFKVPFFYLKK